MRPWNQGVVEPGGRQEIDLRSWLAYGFAAKTWMRDEQLGLTGLQSMPEQRMRFAMHHLKLFWEGCLCVDMR